MGAVKSEKLSWKDRVVQTDLRAAQFNKEVFSFVWSYGKNREFDKIPLFKTLSQEEKETSLDVLSNRIDKEGKLFLFKPKVGITPFIFVQSMANQLRHNEGITKGDILEFFYENAPKKGSKITDFTTFGSDILKYPQVLNSVVWATSQVLLIASSMASDKQTTLPQLIIISAAMTLMLALHSAAYTALQKMSQSNLNGIADPDTALAKSYSRIKERGGHLLALEMERANQNHESLQKL